GNLYPCSETVASGADFDECDEQIDIGGRSMGRAAAKNHPPGAGVGGPARDDAVTAGPAGSRVTVAPPRARGAEGRARPAAHGRAVATWFSKQTAEDEIADDATGSGATGTFPALTGGIWERASVLRYGENPHQGAALYREQEAGGIASAVQLHGKEMSFNN